MNWAKKTIESIDTNLADAREKDTRFFRVEEFKRNILRMDKYSASCPYCAQQKIPVGEITIKIGEAIEIPGKTRREYDRITNRLARHMQKEHGFFAPYHFTYLYSFFGIIAGLILGLLLIAIFPGYTFEMMSTGIIIGLIPAYFKGHYKDKKIRKENRLM